MSILGFFLERLFTTQTADIFFLLSKQINLATRKGKSRLGISGCSNPNCSLVRIEMNMVHRRINTREEFGPWFTPTKSEQQSGILPHPIFKTLLINLYQQLKKI